MHACPPICASCRTNRAALSGCCCPRVPIPLSPWIEQGSQRALLLRPCSRACIRRAAGLIDASGMDITTMRARVEQARVGRLATARPDGRPHVVPCCRSERRGALLGRRCQNEIDRCIATARQHSRCSLGRDVGRPLRRRRAASGGSGSMGERESSTPDPSSTSHCSSSPQVRAVTSKCAPGPRHRDRRHRLAGVALIRWTHSSSPALPTRAREERS